MRKQYFTPLHCHYAECTIYPQRCYDKQPSSLFGRYNLPFVIRFNIELRPLPPPHHCHPNPKEDGDADDDDDDDEDADDDDEDEDADVTHPPSIGSAHLFPAPNLARDTHCPATICTQCTSGFARISRKRISTFVRTRICADLIHANLCQTLNTEIRIESV